MIRIVRRPLVVLSLLALPLFASNAFAEAPSAPAPAHAHAKGGHAHARGGWMESALTLGSLRPDQKKQIEQLKTSVEPSRATATSARKGLLEALATQVAAGKIDRPALQPKVDAVLASATAERATERAALEKLHSILDAKQRAELSTTMEARLAKHGGHGKHAEGSAQAKKVAEAFKQDKFAIDAIAPNDARAHAQLQANHLLDAAQTKTPSMTAEQRTAAAARLRANAAAAARLAF